MNERGEEVLYVCKVLYEKVILSDVLARTLSQLWRISGLILQGAPVAHHRVQAQTGGEDPRRRPRLLEAQQRVGPSFPVFRIRSNRPDPIKKCLK